MTLNEHNANYNHFIVKQKEDFYLGIIEMVVDEWVKFPYIYDVCLQGYIGYAQEVGGLQGKGSESWRVGTMGLYYVHCREQVRAKVDVMLSSFSYQCTISLSAQSQNLNMGLCCCLFIGICAIFPDTIFFSQTLTMEMLKLSCEMLSGREMYNSKLGICSQPGIVSNSQLNTG